eukprot:TRINITY_DN14277_c0_g2_i1.p1 TRINITY_DN14277_c0_g2~~TRINITY_DN14277_c0_g2_i1.p1  ORF type:complete len:282 (+),score=67.28 TRINITY_DN14277_c0_g2_i1:70-915(+)
MCIRDRHGITAKMLVNTLLKENEILRQDILRLRTLLAGRQNFQCVSQPSAPVRPTAAQVKPQSEDSENVLKENCRILNSSSMGSKNIMKGEGKDFKKMEEENEELFRKLFLNGRDAADKGYSSVHVNSVGCASVAITTAQKSVADTPINDTRADLLKKPLSRSTKRRVHTPAQKVTYSNQSYNTVNKSFDVDSILTSTKKKGERSMSVPQKKGIGNLVILQQYKNSVKKSISHIAETISATRCSAKARGALRSGPARRRCGNCAKLLAKGFSTANCACHKV